MSKLDNLKQEISDYYKTLDSFKNDLNEEDKSFKQFFNYILGKENKYGPLNPRIKENKDKTCLLFIRRYIILITSLMKYNSQERKKLYSTETSKIENKAIKENLNQLENLVKRVEKNEIINEFREERQKIFQYLKNKLSYQKQTLFFCLDKYQIYFFYFFEDPDILKYIFFKFYRSTYKISFGPIDLNHYYANFNKKLCLDLVIIFLESSSKNKNNLLPIIFNYELYFSSNFSKKYERKSLEELIDLFYNEVMESSEKITSNEICNIFIRDLKNISNKNEYQTKYKNEKNDKDSEHLESTSDHSNNNNTLTQEEKETSVETNKKNEIIENTESQDKNTVQNNPEADKDNLKEMIKNIERNLEEEIKNRKKRDIEFKNEIDMLKTEINSLKHDINGIQMRERIKSFLNSFNYLLNNSDMQDIKNDPTIRGERIALRFNERYKTYENSPKSKMVCELVKKAASLYLLGNYLAHNIDSKNYRESVNVFKNENKIVVNIPDEKILLLSLCDLNRDYLEDSITFLNNFLDINFERKILGRGVDPYLSFLSK